MQLSLQKGQSFKRVVCEHHSSNSSNDPMMENSVRTRHTRKFGALLLFKELIQLSGRQWWSDAVKSQSRVSDDGNLPHPL